MEKLMEQEALMEQQDQKVRNRSSYGGAGVFMCFS